MSDHDPTPINLVEKDPAFNELSDAEKLPNGLKYGSQVEPQADDEEKVIFYLKGWRFYMLTFAWWMP